MAFLETLSDGYITPYPDINTFTGVNACRVGTHRPREIGPSSRLRCCRPAHRRSVVSRRCRHQSRFHKSAGKDNWSRWFRNEKGGSE